jgi:hypothetical protein
MNPMQRSEIEALQENSKCSRDISQGKSRTRPQSKGKFMDCVSRRAQVFHERLLGDSLAMMSDIWTNPVTANEGG